VAVINDFHLKRLLDRMSEDFKEVNKESRTTSNSEYNLTKPVCDQEESKEAGAKKDLLD